MQSYPTKPYELSRQKIIHLFHTLTPKELTDTFNRSMLNQMHEIICGYQVPTGINEIQIIRDIANKIL